MRRSILLLSIVSALAACRSGAVRSTDIAPPDFKGIVTIQPPTGVADPGLPFTLTGQVRGALGYDLKPDSFYFFHWTTSGAQGHLDDHQGHSGTDITVTAYDPSVLVDYKANANAVRGQVDTVTVDVSIQFKGVRVPTGSVGQATSTLTINPTIVLLNPPVATIKANETQNLTATVQGQKGSVQFRWLLTNAAGLKPAGTLQDSSGNSQNSGFIGSDDTVRYVSNSAVASNDPDQTDTVTVLVLDAQGGNVGSAESNITVHHLACATPACVLVVTLNPASATINPGESESLTALVLGAQGDPKFKWTLKNGLGLKPRGKLDDGFGGQGSDFTSALNTVQYVADSAPPSVDQADIVEVAVTDSQGKSPIIADSKITVKHPVCDTLACLPIECKQCAPGRQATAVVAGGTNFADVTHGATILFVTSLHGGAVNTDFIGTHLSDYSASSSERGNFIFGFPDHPDPDQTIIVDLGQVRDLTTVGATMSGCDPKIDRSVWDFVEISSSLDDNTYTIRGRFGDATPGQFDHLDNVIPDDVYFTSATSYKARTLQYRFGPTAPINQAHSDSGSRVLRAWASGADFDPTGVCVLPGS